ncbi:DUF2637 domain-containing protein [Dactylosporangium sp. CA-139114]|uniref:DUF2637 domain-containing protein n=1 Tax=Dactylosporangium sp. CA-139114 TaxID=3239931 RepID=UPI003D955352
MKKVNWTRIVIVISTVVVTLACFFLSFDAIRAVAILCGARPQLAFLFPLAIDGLMVIATMVAADFKRMNRSTKYPWFVVVCGTAFSVFANGLHAYDQNGNAVAIGFSAIPAVALALAVHLLIDHFSKINHYKRELEAARVAEEIRIAEELRQAELEAEVRLAEEQRLTEQAEKERLEDEADASSPDKTARKRTGRKVVTPKAPKRTKEETLALVMEVKRAQPDLKQSEVAKRAGISDRYLRDLLRSPQLAGATA